MIDALTFEEAGSFFMGFFVSWIAFYFFNRDDNFNGTEFAAFMTAIFGGAVISVFGTYLTTDDRWIFWIYPIGLVAGMIVFGILSTYAKIGEIMVTTYGKKHKDKAPGEQK